MHASSEFPWPPEEADFYYHELLKRFRLEDFFFLMCIGSIYKKKNSR